MTDKGDSAVDYCIADATVEQRVAAYEAVTRRLAVYESVGVPYDETIGDFALLLSGIQ